MNENFSLCGGVVFSMLVYAKKNYYPENTGTPLTHSVFLHNLGDVMKEGYSAEKNIISDQTISQYKCCDQKAKKLFPLLDEDDIEFFSDSVVNDYLKILEKMSNFINENISVESTVKMNKLVKVLLGLVDSDSSISDSHKFYISPDGTPVTKQEIGDMTTFTFESLLLGLWHYAVQVKNHIGNDTCEVLFPRKGNSPRTYDSKFHKTVREVGIQYLPSDDIDTNAESDSKFDGAATTDSSDEINDGESDTCISDDMLKLLTGNIFQFNNYSTGTNNHQFAIMVNNGDVKKKKEK